MTFYLGVVDPAADGTWGVVFPDLPGCYSAGDGMDDLFTNSIEAIRMWAEDAVRRGGVPPARDSAALMADPEVRKMLKDAGPTGCLIQVPLLIDGGRSVRATISLDAQLLETIDEAAKRQGLTRSTFLASAARDKIARLA
ncbi:DNA-binding protein [Beijerinckiaceae bacterium RH AL1]|nr:type II toxin-antitoxin system HicB family antitoxin [Beijerinckiaceae bacterium]VVB44911.1 DNA-binding protein [Beijerinckiaceae bacterium RH CH11]VVB44990.1 DNA-binding protein [Beijerinckiaceae bacterium RH AL8]VVC54601.1 DNA-binding protein [Beijerinckiaceae bacterium RH AL1]